MSRIFSLPVLALLAGFAGPGIADVCKWVDEYGVFHYAETCPEGVAGTEFRTEAPPSEEQVEAAIRRSEEMLSERQARSGLSEQEKTEKFLAGRAKLAGRATTESLCADAFRKREILDLQLPVYYDDRNSLYYRDSLHHHWYEGPRIYLDDNARQLESDLNRQLIVEECAEFKPQRLEYVVRFRDAPNVQETLYLLRYPDSPAGPPARDVCQYAEFLSKEMHRYSSGLQSDDSREFEALINRNCG